MNLYDGEDWYLQLDSHHRFAQDWDAKLVEQAALTERAKPVLTTYAAAFTPGAEAHAREQVTIIGFDRFSKEGVVLTKPGVIAEPPAVPPRARFISAHFLFAPGSFVCEVPYDPELYFLGEEITLAVRAFTHGYDLFHPSRHILWHEYTRANRTRHWDDHAREAGVNVAWHDRDAVSLAKVTRLLTEPWADRDGVGSARSVAEYEKYAGVSFRQRQVQDYTRQCHEPPNPAARPHWAERIQDHRIEMRVELAQLPSAAIKDPTFWYVGVHDSAGREIYRQDAGSAELGELLADGGDSVTLAREFDSEQTPASWTVLPYSSSQGWLDRVTGPVRAEPLIFVSIASYRDPELVSTISDCLAKASHPERLRFVVCWQHGPEERLPEWIHESQFHVLDVDFRESRGACWARAAVMEQWAGEDWYLQIDSHQRFAQDWDTTLIRQAALTSSPRPLLSSVTPTFTLGEPPSQETPLQMEFAGFQANGVPQVKPGFLPQRIAHSAPVGARFICAHFLFAPGSFARDVPYDPEMYFSGEEYTMAVRAFTHGYDLFHPTAVVTWHAADYRTGHWNDHTREQGVEVPWHQLYQKSVAKVARFFDDPRVGRFGLGQERTFADYEAYAGISFRHRRVQDYTRLNQEPPNPPASPDWPERVRDHRMEITVDVSQLPEAAIKDPVLWCVAIYDGDGRELYRQDASSAELAGLLAAGSDRITLVRQFSSEAVPASWTVLPLSASAGWLDRLRGAIPLPLTSGSSVPVPGF